MDPDEVVIRNLLIGNAARFPDDRYASFEDGSVWTWRAALEAASGAASVLRSAGVQQGDRVAIMLPNGPDFLRAWWGVTLLGAIIVPINLAYRGNILRHLVNLAQPVAVIADPEYIDRFDAASNIKRIAPYELRENSQQVPDIPRPIEGWDIEALMMTSGTTGPSKLSATTYRHIFTGGSWFMLENGCGPEDVFLVDLPLFHLGAMYQVTTTLRTRTQIVVRTRPELSKYWDIIREHGVTAGLLLSTMVPYLMAQPPSPSDRNHTMRLLIAAPLPRDAEAFKERFGIEQITTALGSTELPGPVVGDPRDQLTFGYCGRVRNGFQLRLVDDNDEEVPIGEPGEMIIRSDTPWTISAGYVGDDEATAKAWRNGWFHSGDRLRSDHEGRLFFVDRAKESIRRRGENISTAEVEAELAEHPSVFEVACVPYRAADWVDDEVKVWIVPSEGRAVDFAELLHFCAERMPHFMVPRFFELTKELPKTASTRVQKFQLREKGNSDQTWDREAHGLLVTRSGIRKQ